MNKERLNFDPIREVNYLKGFSGELRKEQLELNISTSLEELFLSAFSHVYQWDGEKIIDKKTGKTVRDLSKNCEFEYQNTKRVEEQLKAGKDLVVCVSPKNIELDYPDDMVDFWIRGEGERLTWMRFKVDMTKAELDDFEAINKEGYVLADLIRMLSLVKEEKGVSVALIEKLARKMTTEFESEFGEKIYLDGEMMTRMYVAIRLEVEKQSRELGTEPRKGVLLRSEIKKYLYGEMRVQKFAGGGCGGSSLGGQFASEGIIIVKTINGISFRNGKTEGLRYCSQCGCWYSGEKCPICK
ncbi:MAG: hypothetical protein PHR98_00530 [Candidatus Shapirobacteria bacterium]|jgi:hypothetical protein|nr:hypothetical protein [Candidatus Shapirobacteria bacterium]